MLCLHSCLSGYYSGLLYFVTKPVYFGHLKITNNLMTVTLIICCFHFIPNCLIRNLLALIYIMMTFLNVRTNELTNNSSSTA